MLEDAIDAVGGGWGLGGALLVGAGLLVARGGRPLAKSAVRGWLTVSSSARGVGGSASETIRGAATYAADTVRGATATAVEQAQDLYAESKAELTSRGTGGRTNSSAAKA